MLAFAILGIILATVANAINTIVPHAYMDEIFHIPQAQQYCNGELYAWDPKITTPPGLYLFSPALIGVQCTVASLRAVNVVFGLLTFLILHRIVLLVHPNQHHATWYALALTLFPVSFFYHFLYYTDSGSTFFVLLAYLMLRQQRYTLSALSGMVAMVFRQTNVVWVAYMAGLALVHLIQNDHKTRKQDTVHPLPTWHDVTSPGQGLRSVVSTLATPSVTRYAYLVIYYLHGYVIALIAFGAFLAWNKGIVLGDRDNHVAGLHIPQLFYYVSFAIFFACPWILSTDRLWRVFQTAQRAHNFGVGGLAIILCAVHYFTMEHPFLLSDNRHYSFYVWKDIYRRHWLVRYALAPVYLASGWCHLDSLAKNTSIFWVLGYLATLGLTLVPSPLLEFRYFILPFMFYALHMEPPKSFARIALATAFYIAINAVTLYLFLFRPFTWPSVPTETQRFMW